MHVHVSALDAMSTFLYVIVMGFLWRLASAHLAKSTNDNVSSIGKAMATIY